MSGTRENLTKKNTISIWFQRKLGRLRARLGEYYCNCCKGIDVFRGLETWCWRRARIIVPSSIAKIIKNLHCLIHFPERNDDGIIKKWFKGTIMMDELLAWFILFKRLFELRNDNSQLRGGFALNDVRQTYIAYRCWIDSK